MFETTNQYICIYVYTFSCLFIHSLIPYYDKYMYIYIYIKNIYIYIYIYIMSIHFISHYIPKLNLMLTVKPSYSIVIRFTSCDRSPKNLTSTEWSIDGFEMIPFLQNQSHRKPQISSPLRLCRLSPIISQIRLYYLSYICCFKRRCCWLTI